MDNVFSFNLFTDMFTQVPQDTNKYLVNVQDRVEIMYYNKSAMLRERRFIEYFHKQITDLPNYKDVSRLLCMQLQDMNVYVHLTKNMPDLSTGHLSLGNDPKLKNMSWRVTLESVLLSAIEGKEFFMGLHMTGSERICVSFDVRCNGQHIDLHFAEEASDLYHYYNKTWERRDIDNEY